MFLLQNYEDDNKALSSIKFYDIRVKFYEVSRVKLCSRRKNVVRFPTVKVDIIHVIFVVHVFLKNGGMSG